MTKSQWSFYYLRLTLNYVSDKMIDPSWGHSMKQLYSTPQNCQGDEIPENWKIFRIEES